MKTKRINNFTVSAPPSGDVLNAPAGFTPEVFPFVSVAAPSHSLASGQPMLTEAFVPAVPPTFSGKL